MSDCRVPMPNYDEPKVCFRGHQPTYLNRMTMQYRGLTELVYIGDLEAWICPLCHSVYAYRGEQK